LLRRNSRDKSSLVSSPLPAGPSACYHPHLKKKIEEIARHKPSRLAGIFSSEAQSALPQENAPLQ
jgi:hypothetical protein